MVVETKKVGLAGYETVLPSLVSRFRARMTTREILADIHALQRQMLEFESRYGVRSDVFYAA